MGILRGWNQPLFPWDPTLPSSPQSPDWSTEGAHQCLLIKRRKEEMLFQVLAMSLSIIPCLVVKRGYTWIQILGPLHVCETLLTLLSLSVP